MKWPLSLRIAAASFLCAPLLPQQLPGSGVTAKAAAPIDLTGFWVSLVTEDWRYRMLTAPKGDYFSFR